MTPDQARRRHRLAWLAGTTAAVAFVAWILMPKPELYGNISFSTLVTDRGRQPLKLLPAGDGRYRLFVALDDVAPVAREATLLYEDRRFYQHPGVDPIALARAAWTTYVARERPVGGSTITMQLRGERAMLDCGSASTPGHRSASSCSQRAPCSLNDTCSLELTAASGQAPRIRSPQPTLVYPARVGAARGSESTPRLPHRTSRQRARSRRPCRTASITNATAMLIHQRMEVLA